MLNQSSRQTKKRKEAKEKKLLYSINNIYNNIKNMSTRFPGKGTMKR
jgi:hypothetical protein